LEFGGRLAPMPSRADFGLFSSYFEAELARRDDAP
jgi:hypothetical protein